MLNQIKNFIIILRPINLIIIVVSIFLAALLVGVESFSLPDVYIASIVSVLIAAGGNVINDYFDFEIDAVNNINRTIPSGKISRAGALIYYITLTTSGILFSFFLTKVLIILTLVAAVLLFLYSYKIKKILLLNNLTVSLLTGLTLVYGAIAAGDYRVGIVPSIFAFFTNFIREILKDVEDIQGDSKQSIKSFSITFGIKWTIKFCIFLIIIEMIIVTIPFLTNYYSIEYFILVMMFVNLSFVYILKLLLKKDNLVEVHKSIVMLKLIMIMGIVSIIFGK